MSSSLSGKSTYQRKRKEKEDNFVEDKIDEVEQQENLPSRILSFQFELLVDHRAVLGSLIENQNVLQQQLKVNEELFLVIERKIKHLEEIFETHQKIRKVVELLLLQNNKKQRFEE